MGIAPNSRLINKRSIVIKTEKKERGEIN